MLVEVLLVVEVAEVVLVQVAEVVLVEVVLVQVVEVLEVLLVEVAEVVALDVGEGVTRPCDRSASSLSFIRCAAAGVDGPVRIPSVRRTVALPSSFRFPSSPPSLLLSPLVFLLFFFLLLANYVDGSKPKFVA